MSISFISQAVGVNSLTMPSHQAGDLLLFFAFRDGSATAPTIPSGKNQWAPAIAGTTCSGIIGWMIAKSGAEVSGTWTNATEVIVQVYRGTNALALGAYVSNAGTASSVTYSALTLQNPYSQSWVAGFAGHRSTDTTLETAPSGMTARSTKNDATAEASGHDSNGIVSSWSSAAVAVGGTASGWVTIVVEIIEDDTTVVGVACSTAGIVSSTNTLVLDKPYNCQVGDVLVACILFACSTTGAESLPAGWTVPTNGKVAWDATALSCVYIAYRVVDGTEGSTFSFTSTSTGTKFGSQGIMHRITGCDKASPADVADNQSATSGTTGTFKSVTTTRDGDYVVYAGLMNQAAVAAKYNFVGPSGLSFTGYATDAAAPNAFSSFGLLAGATGAVGSKTVTTPTLTGGANWQAVTFSIKAFKRYNLTAASGSYAQTGTASALKRGRVLPAASGSYAQTGTALALRHGYVLTAASSAYNLTGTAVAFPRTRILVAGSGSYTQAGTAAALELGRRLVAASGAYALTGSGLSLSHGYPLSAGAGAYNLTGTALAFLRTRILPAVAGSYSLSGTASALTHGFRLPAGSGAYLLTGATVGLLYARTLVAGSGSYAQSGTAAVFNKGRTLGASPGGYALSGTALSLKFARKLVAASGAYALSGAALALHRGRTLAAGAGSYNLTGASLAFRISYIMAPDAGAYAFVGSNARLAWSRIWFAVAVSPETYAAEAQTPKTWTSRPMTAETYTAQAGAASIWTPIPGVGEAWSAE